MRQYVKPLMARGTNAVLTLFGRGPKPKKFVLPPLKPQAKIPFLQQLWYPPQPANAFTRSKRLWGNLGNGGFALSLVAISLNDEFEPTESMEEYFQTQFERMVNLDCTPKQLPPDDEVEELNLPPNLLPDDQVKELFDEVHIPEAAPPPASVKSSFQTPTQLPPDDEVEELNLPLNLLPDDQFEELNLPLNLLPDDQVEEFFDEVHIPEAVSPLAISERINYEPDGAVAINEDELVGNDGQERQQEFVLGNQLFLSTDPHDGYREGRYEDFNFVPPPNVSDCFMCLNVNDDLGITTSSISNRNNVNCKKVTTMNLTRHTNERLWDSNSHRPPSDKKNKLNSLPQSSLIDDNGGNNFNSNGNNVNSDGILPQKQKTSFKYFYRNNAEQCRSL